MSECAGAPIGVVVVHGVGDPKPGDTLDSLVEGLCGRNTSLTIEASGRRVLGGSSYETEVVVPQRRLVNKTSGTTIFVSEVYWGDVGRVGASWWGVATAVGSLAMGLHALIFAGGGVSGRAGKRPPHLPDFKDEKAWLRAAFWTAFVGAYHIKGVLMPLAVAVVLLGAFSMMVGSNTGPPSWWLLLVLPSAGMLALFLPAPNGRKRPSTSDQKDSPQRERWVMPTLAAGIWCVAGYVVPICGALLAISTLGRPDGRLVGLVFSSAFSLCHTLVIFYTVRADWQTGRRRFAKKAAFWAATISWIVLAVLLLPRDDGRVMRDLGSVLMSAYHVALGLAALWVFAIGACCSLSTFTRDATQRERGKVIFLGYAFEFSLWVAIATTLGWLAWQLPNHERLAWLDVEAAYGPGAWFPLVPIIFVFILVVTLLIAHTVDRIRQRPKFEIGDLVGSWPLPVVTIATALICVKAVAVALNLPFLPMIDHLPPLVTTIGALFLSGLVLVVRSFRGPLLHGLDLANDVARYFRGRSWASSTHHHSDELLKTRFRLAVDDLSDAKVCRLVVVAHSQGTVIAADALGDWINTSRVDLLTMGSPLLGLYARFFGVRFGTLIPDVRTRAKSWMNLYRGDDYVGRRLEGGVTDIPIEGTGHEGYWTDARVLAELERLIGLHKSHVPEATTRAREAVTESL